MKKLKASLLGCTIMVIGALILWVGGMALIAIPATWVWNYLFPNHISWLVMWGALLVITFIGNFIAQAARK